MLWGGKQHYQVMFPMLTHGTLVFVGLHVQLAAEPGVGCEALSSSQQFVPAARLGYLNSKADIAYRQERASVSHQLS